MAYSQKPLLELLKAGRLPGETSAPRHIETVISNVFLFPRRVYKVYKNDSDFFNKDFQDISDRAARLEFTRRDFEWNQTLAPGVYLELTGVAAGKDQVVVGLPEESIEELMIVMKRVRVEDFLFARLRRGTVAEKESFLIGRGLAIALAAVKRRPPPQNYFAVARRRIIDLRNFLRPVVDKVSDAEADAWCDFLESFRQTNRLRFENELSRELVFGGDIHSHNVAIVDDRLRLLDTFPPKEDWRVEYRDVPLYRLGLDLWVLGGRPEMFEACVRGYEAGGGRPLDRRFDDFYLLWAGAIMASYLFMLARTDPETREAAEKFHRFMKERFTVVNSR